MRRDGQYSNDLWDIKIAKKNPNLLAGESL